MTQTTNGTVLNEIIQDSYSQKPIDIRNIATLVDFDDYIGLAKITNFLIEKKHTRRSEWEELLHRQRVAKFFNAPFPETPMEFVNIWTKHYGLEMDFKGNVSSKSFRTSAVIKMYEDLEVVNQKINDATNSKTIKTLLSEKRIITDNIKSCEIRPTLDVIIRKLRISRDTFKLKFNDSQLADSIEEWSDIYKSSRRGEIFSSIIYLHDEEQIKRADNDLDKICEALFDENHLTKSANKNILRKFIWQVKRKIKGSAVTNHIMPVFTGAQGTGKSTFMHRFISPVAELSSPTDFKQLTDDRNISLFKNAVLIIDEMGFANRADIESVKSIMTATELARRPMRQNITVQIRQDATMIGASNKEVEQLIRDETGLRRFIGIRFKNNPDWNLIKDIDYAGIWRSVDEDGEDPTLESIDVILEAQEIARCKTPCEMWVKTLKINGTSKKTASNWFSEYRIWESLHFNKKNMDYDNWCKELRRLTIVNNDFPFTYHLDGSTELFEFTSK